MKKLLAANWKMNPDFEDEAVRLARLEDERGVVICPPFPFLGGVGRALKRAALGAQDLFWEKGGAYTGEVSAIMLKGLGARYVIVGHSERRRLGETDDAVNRKLKAALKAGLRPILCVGEPREARRKGVAAARVHIRRQLRLGLKGIRKRIVIAYEPIWAIGTGKSDSPRESAAIARFIKTAVRPKPRVLYGGSVASQNARSFLQYKEIDGALVGGASLRGKEFKKIISTTQTLQ
ncbi:triose-phosphate isomerase [Candidatus Parcubacteria bacterium]|nr:MAG: triose-phosphate isomerase [Candidatus Parcubacteria bacterium]